MEGEAWDMGGEVVSARVREISPRVLDVKAWESDVRATCRRSTDFASFVS